MEIKPNFLMVGAPKAGTTSIARYLSEHPDIFISEEKEPFYFLPNILTDTNPKDPMYSAIEKRAHLSRESYFGLFKNAINEKRRGEATVHYLYHYDEVIPRIKNELGDVPIIIILRNPVERAYSNFKFQNRGQLNTFEQALKLEAQRKAAGFNSFWYYKEGGMYYQSVKAYLKNFSNVYVGIYDDLKDNPIKFMQSIYEFLEVDCNFKPKIEVIHNRTVVPKNKLIHSIYYYKNRLGISLMLSKKNKNRLRKILFKKNSNKISPDTLKSLQAEFKPDIQSLEKLIGRDLSSWYN